ncbi:MAG: hypothetical protein KBT21_07495 [Treponema sp.]|nr:hypothetical protein [Candidatus Treponema merdequi]
MMTARQKHILEIVFFVILIASIIFCSVVIIANLAKIRTQDINENIPVTDRDYSILITGTSENISFLKEVYEGATIVSNFYDSAIQYNIPEITNKETSVQSLFDYAGFINSDCIVAYINSSDTKFFQAVNSSGETIPLITIGLYSPDIPQISHIGINYAELGNMMAQEAVDFLNGNGVIYILNTIDVNDFYGSTLIGNVYNTLNAQENIIILDSAKLKNSSLSIEDDIRQQIASSGKIDLILSLSEKGTVLAAQTAIDLNLLSKTKIIGYGEGQDSKLYYDKQIVTELFCINAVDIGKKAVQEFFEYKTNGSANSYVTADIQLLKNKVAK